jgi:adenine-specific DNA methylase
MRTDQYSLFETGAAPTALAASPQGLDRRAIEEASFPFEHLSDIAEIESWRKEINRPIYHIHKWWAQRLGSVFRGIVLGAFAPPDSDVLSLFYRRVELPDVVVFDPFMGSGTTLGETLKLGGRAVGRDINPVAYFLVRNALDLPRRDEVLKTFREIERDVSSEILQFYDAQLPEGRKGQVLYCFWVKQVACPNCEHLVDLFSSYIFAQHAYPKEHPEARALCPACGGINVTRYDASQVVCQVCNTAFATDGPARGTKARCPSCSQTFTIAPAVRCKGAPPPHRLYAKLVLTVTGEKVYLPADDYDRALYDRAASELRRRADAYPVVAIAPGYNTDQALNYCYRHWHEFFNERQLLCLSLLAARIREIGDERQRAVFCCLFSGTLEFNNMFASFKGEGTGAVRHMFNHHILKPERTPLEANLWGTPRSSGSFSTLFETRLLRALDYCERPFELRAVRNGGAASGEKVHGLSSPFFYAVADDYAEFERGKRVYVSCGDSAQTDLPDGAVDAVITDPPFFDNVHYSQLADFFYVWQRFILGAHGYYAGETTRSVREVQQSEAAAFSERLGGVWSECHRVLKKDGLLVFTYHHSRAEGWRCLLDSLGRAGFVVTRAHPVKAEMSVATPKHQAKDPIDLDMILVCRKRPTLVGACSAGVDELVQEATAEAESQIERFRRLGRTLSRNDVRVVLMAQTLVRLSRLPDLGAALGHFDAAQSLAEAVADRLCQSC